MARAKSRPGETLWSPAWESDHRPEFDDELPTEAPPSRKTRALVRAIVRGNRLPGPETLARLLGRHGEPAECAIPETCEKEFARLPGLHEDRSSLLDAVQGYDDTAVSFVRLANELRVSVRDTALHDFLGEGRGHVNRKVTPQAATVERAAELLAAQAASNAPKISLGARAALAAAGYFLPTRRREWVHLAATDAALIWPSDRSVRAVALLALVGRGRRGRLPHTLEWVREGT